MRSRIWIAAAVLLAGCGGHAARQVVSGSTTTAPPTTESATATTTVTSTTNASTTTTAVRKKPPTTTTTAAPAGGPTTTYATPTTLAYNQTAYPDCMAAQLSAAASTDKSTYTSGQTVHFAIVVTNRSSTACAYSDRAQIELTTPSGGTESLYYQCFYGVEAMPTSYLLKPGESFDADEESWDQTQPQDCHTTTSPPAPAPRGHYVASPVAHGHDGQVTRATTAPFQLQ